MPISSLIVHTQPDLTNDVVTQILGLGQTCTPETQGDCVVVLTETPDPDTDKQIWDKIHAMRGVVSVTLAYHNFEDVHGAAQ